jgi:type IV secretory pathway VirB6-like protein
LPIFGDRTFPDLIVDGPAQLANQISLSSDQQIDTYFNNILAQNAAPTNAWDIPNLFAYWALVSLVQFTRAVMFAVYSFGLMAQAVIVLVGPVFIPFLLFQPMSFMFWGWFKCLLQYSFYPLICACFSSVYTTFLLNLPAFAATSGPTAATLMALAPFMLIMGLGMLAVPVVVNGLFSGSSSAGAPLSRFLS